MTSTALIVHEVPGLGLRQQAIADEVTIRRLGTETTSDLPVRDIGL